MIIFTTVTDIWRALLHEYNKFRCLDFFPLLHDRFIELQQKTDKDVPNKQLENIDFYGRLKFNVLS